MAFKYFDTEHAINIHDEIINKSGGRHGIVKIDLLKSTLAHVQNDEYYPDIENKVTHLLYSINKNHSFIDGNKRSSIALSAYFLELNNFDYCISKFIINMENIAVFVANGDINLTLLHEIICSIIYEDDYSEELKLKLYNAMYSSFINLT